MSISSTYKNNESPLNYSGGKFKILDFIHENLPQDIDTFYDVFGGGFNVGSNIFNCKKVVYNDYNNYVFALVKKLWESDYESVLRHIENRVEEFGLAYGSDSYYEMRKHYNSKRPEDRDPLDLYVLILFGFQHQIRFNKKHDFNNPVGKSGLNESIKEKLINFGKRDDRDFEFINQDFRKFSTFNFSKDDLVYCDPPYLITSAAYNDGGKRGFDGWDEKIEKEFLSLLSELNSNGVRFMLSNVIYHKDKKNEILSDWIESNNFKVKTLDSKRKEILVINY